MNNTQFRLELEISEMKRQVLDAKVLKYEGALKAISRWGRECNASRHYLIDLAEESLKGDTDER